MCGAIAQPTMRRRSEEPPTVQNMTSLLRKATDKFREDAQAQYLARRLDYDDRLGRSKDRATVTKEMIEWFTKEWSHLDTRACIAPGKRALAEFRRLVQEAYSISLSDHRIISGFTRADLPSDLKGMLFDLEAFRQTEPA